MAYKALYRTYRPSSFNEVAGQKHIVKTLTNALAENKIAHAYLFCGPRGTGKTSMARIFAKALNCNEGFGEQCNECENCKAITEGKHPDVIEIDAASNRGIDDIRDLISKVKYSPIMGKYKVYIIDEVHMMTTEAFNALLKTLEEPPSNVVFILATTEPYKLMPTILSRCQRYDFTKVSDGDIYNLLINICENENVEIEEESLTLLVSLADGGVRDSLSMLDQAIAYCGSSITLTAIQELYGISSTKEKLDLLIAINNKDIMKITTLINSLVANGIDIKRLTNDLLMLLKDLLIYNTTKDGSLLNVLKLEDCDILSIPNKQINSWIDILLNALSQYRQVNNILSLFEITLLKLASYEEEGKIVEKVVVKEVVEEIKEDKKVVVEPTSVQPKVEPVPEKEILPEVNQPILSNVNFSSVSPLMEEGNKIEYQIEDIINIMVQATKEEKNKLNDVWGNLDKLAMNNRVGKYASMIKLTSPRIVAKDAIVLETKFTNIANKFNLKENQEGFSKVIEALISQKCIVLCLTQGEYVEAVRKFSNLQQANKLPHPLPIEIDVSINKNTSTNTKTQELADDLMKGE